MHLPEEVLKLFENFRQSGYQLYIVGGAVRDLLLQRQITDWDFTTDATPEEILKIIPEGFYNNQFGTVGLSTPLGLFEVTTMRKESGYSDFRHPTDVSWTKDIREDLARRDFTINAVALTPSNVISTEGRNLKIKQFDFAHHKSADLSLIARDDNEWTIIDPYDGQKDLEQRLVRAVGEPGKRFHEDALRLMRAIRFATQLNFNIEENTLSAIKQSKDLIKNVSWERIRDELFKILSADDPYRGIVMLRESGVLQVILPELERCFGLMQEGPKHDRIYEIGEHSLLSLKHCPSKDPLVRFATLIHDIGKPDTFDTQEDGNVTFYGHDVVGARIARKIAERFKLSRKDIEKVANLVRWHMFTVTEHQTDSAIRRFIKNIGLENIDDMIALRVGDRLGGGTEKAVSWRMEEFRKRIDQVLEKPFSVSDLKVNGNDVMDITGLRPGREVGEILNKLFEEVVEDVSKNSREILLQKINEFKRN